MIKISIGLALLSALFAAGSVQAATANKANVTYDLEDTVAPAQQQAYESGVKSFMQCLKENGFKYTVTALRHETGNTGMYSYLIGPLTWRGFDAAEIPKPCMTIMHSNIDPNASSYAAAFSVVHEGFSREPKNVSLHLVDVVSFWLKPGMAAHDAFTKAIKAIYAAENKTHWPVYSEMDEIVAAGPGAPDYQLVVMNRNWAEFGAQPNPSLMHMLEKAYGKKKAHEIWQSGMNAIAKTGEHVDSYAPDLSYTHSK